MDGTGLQAFYRGDEFDAYEYLGCHYEPQATTFRVFAPAAAGVDLIGDFNQWQPVAMSQVYDGNFYELAVPGVELGQFYKYRVHQQDGRVVDHMDPYGYGMELRPNTASVVRTLDCHEFHDKAWMDCRSRCYDRPLNIYEVHAGSWRTREGAETVEEGWLTYDELAQRLPAYAKQHGFTHIELMPLCEYPSDESWGYQGYGFFAPTARYGDVAGLKALVDACHQEGVGVLLDFAAVHFAVNDYGLGTFDGTALYEFPSADVGYNEWGSKNFNHSHPIVRSFLQSSVHYWLAEYHMDGVRVDAVSNLIYWQGDPGRGVNAGAVQFLQNLNDGIHRLEPTAIMAAEDSTNYPGVTHPTHKGGLGFDYKWDMGWMNDTLDYFRLPPIARQGAYHKLTFSMMYFYDERYLLPFSHDETVRGKATIVQKMNGQYEGKFSQARALYAYMYAHPGKKLDFMGNELGQMREWDEKREQDWMLLSYPVHDAFRTFRDELSRLYDDAPALSQQDYQPHGFEWVDCSAETPCCYAFERRAQGQRILCAFNFGDLPRAYELAPEGVGTLEELLDTDWQRFGGATACAPVALEPEKDRVTLELAPFSAQFWLVNEKAPEE
ncbi:1,4-alpha-glucan branching protein GlgB [Olsenella sp. YH-ols2217]|uniref:1,4-alpha-glucan branching enzyme n=1 Tax=Kribbibacterium absianum TaxID=3044210 RepID=A0ABT6ZHJ9_9ACTN|nr:MULTISPECIES: 1,4-alpha-glucan branching protein GlgB [unclassified Olsenella]MDJ1121036.1 1,4-alpha-glucan branching protein GlgB [Olsenella sp. YH-ols2216]MDJ1128527.1 1,4-alpha-glucan branching protein GlgB [Olsenella sp. YH-ols2217]